MTDSDMVKFISFIIDLVDDFDCRYHFIHGGCYELYKVIKHYFPDAQCVIKNDLKHCATLYEGEIFDINGKVMDPENYVLADTEHIRYMERSFGLNIEKLQSLNLIKMINNKNI